MEVVPQDPQDFADGVPFPVVPGPQGNEVVARVRPAEDEFQPPPLGAFEAPRLELCDGALEVFCVGLVDLKRQTK